MLEIEPTRMSDLLSFAIDVENSLVTRTVSNIINILYIAYIVV